MKIKQTTTSFVLYSITLNLLLNIVKVTGQRILTNPAINCEQYRDNRGQLEITGNDDSLYCLHKHLYKSALSSSPNNAPDAYVNELLQKALTRCSFKKTQSSELSKTEKKTCKSRKCKKLRYHGRRRKRFARKSKSNRRRRYKAEHNECNWERKEVRMLSRSEWNQFTKRINILKKPIALPGGGSFIPYDVISNVHRGRRSLEAAHRGSNFPSWHRIYLLVMEAAIGIPIPYWDHRMDYDMDEPIDSIVWTDEFFGPGIGEVKSGPFANWITAHNEPLARNIGLTGSLISEYMVKGMLRYKSHDPIIYPTIKSYSLEDIHNGPHRWVAGQLPVLRKAPQDPIFFLHHSFVDYLWYQFRKNMRETGNIDPATDYPDKGPASQGRYEYMIPFSKLRNIHGYSDFIEGLSSFKPPPKCPHCGGSNYLECDAQINRCKSKASKAVVPDIQFLRRQAMNIVIRGTKFVSPITDIRTSGVALSFLQLANNTLG
uniref:Tyrosinase n=1 Tax=Azumapecten farreri TaxID=106299 RepID=A0A076JQI5_AZUFA|nr:tyrosinase [Azumapecten farreri]